MQNTIILNNDYSGTIFFSGSRAPFYAVEFELRKQFADDLAVGEETEIPQQIADALVVIDYTLQLSKKVTEDDFTNILYKSGWWG